MRHKRKFDKFKMWNKYGKREVESAYDEHAEYLDSGDEEGVEEEVVALDGTAVVDGGK